METEWQHYITQCIDIIVLIAEERPYQVFEQIVSVLKPTTNKCHL